MHALEWRGQTWKCVTILPSVWRRRFKSLKFLLSWNWAIEKTPKLFFMPEQSLQQISNIILGSLLLLFGIAVYYTLGLMGPQIFCWAIVIRVRECVVETNRNVSASKTQRSGALPIFTHASTFLSEGPTNLLGTLVKGGRANVCPSQCWRQRMRNIGAKRESGIRMNSTVSRRSIDGAAANSVA